MAGASGVGEALLAAYRDLLNAESRLGDSRSPRGLRVGASIVDQWPVLHEYLNIYARGLSPAGVLVLGGAPDAGSRATGIPFTGAFEARANLGLGPDGGARSPAGAAFWRAVAVAQESCEGAGIESLFGTVHLAHAQPFDADAGQAEVRRASAAHVLRLLAETRPQAIVAVGAHALATLGRALGDARLTDLARAPEDTWTLRHPAASPVASYPCVDVPLRKPFRARVVPVPALDGVHAELGARTMARVLAYAWA